MRCVPNHAAILDQERLRGLVTDSESLGNGPGQPLAFDDENDRRFELRIVFGEVYEVLVDVSADRTLRAMLENENGIGFGSLQESFEILILS